MTDWFLREEGLVVADLDAEDERLSRMLGDAFNDPRALSPTTVDECVLQGADHAVTLSGLDCSNAAYTNFDRLTAHAAKHGIPMQQVSAVNIRDDALDPRHRFVLMLLHVRNPDGTKGSRDGSAQLSALSPPD